MADKSKQGFHTVESNVEEMEEKIRRHRRKIVIRGFVLFLIAVIFIGSAGIYYQFKEYVDFEIVTEILRSDSEATQYETFAGNILRYNNDGAFYADLSDNLIWNQAYEMQNPMVDTCESYAVVADRQGTQIYIMNTIGVQGAIETNKPIEAVCVGNQGIVAILTQEEGTSYLELYNRSGESIASGEIHMENSGYPLDIALSNDANKLAVAILDISKGKARTTVAFYNFGSVGQNEIDNIVGSYTYEDTIIPEISFITNDVLIAFGDSQVALFEGTQKPEETWKMPLEKEVKSIFYDEEYFGLVYDKEGAENLHSMEIYDTKGKLRMEKDFKMNYQKVELLANHQVCIMDDTACEIYTLRGIKKFSYTFDAGIHKVLSKKSNRNYIFILDGAMDEVKLK
ncbi:MAG: DUF5711 family protein [Roseburia sp.]|nr:DUF5711 family protein [Roseburia sp.]